MPVLEAGAVFTPGAFPTHTYVSRSLVDEKTLKDALALGGAVTSIVGPSKTGKTVLVNRVVEEDRLVSLSGSLIDSAESLWSQAGEIVGSPGLGPFEMISLLADEARVLLIDDFHYVERATQRRIAQQLKDAVAKGVRVVVVAVPHRSDDAIRANPDLRGRVRMIDVDYWDPGELKKIAETGFPLLNVHLRPKDINRIAEESLRSPQLMQALCLEVCRTFSLDRPQERTEQVSLDDEVLNTIAKATSNLTDCKTPHDILSEGPRERGQRRTQYPLRDGTTGDVYTVILRALATDPPRLDFPYAELKRWIERVVQDDAPRGASLQQAIVQMDSLIRERIPDDRVLEWDPERQYIDIPDPHFLFYLRWGVSA